MYQSKVFVLFHILIIPYLTVALEPELKQLNVLFRHGDRTPESFSKRFPNDPFMNMTFYPMGSGALTNEGKLRMYHFGQFLRERYSKFLGPIYEGNTAFAISSAPPRTQMSLQLVLAGLYPPQLHDTTKWHEKLNWQPIPVFNNAYNRDIYFNGDRCEKFVEEYGNVYNSSEVQGKLKKYEDYLEELREKSGKKKPLTLNDILLLHNNLDIENRMHLQLEPWMSETLADKRLKELRQLFYEIQGYNDVLRKIQAGAIVPQIMNEMLQMSNKSSNYPRKVILFGGHDKNLINIFQLLDMYDSHFPEFGSALIFELLYQNEQFYVKMLYHLGIPVEVKILTIPGCTELCPLDSFINLIKSKGVSTKFDCKINGDSYFVDED